MKNVGAQVYGWLDFRDWERASFRRDSNCLIENTRRRSFLLSRNKNNKSKTIQWKKLRNCDVMEDNYVRHFCKF